jgi:hypothetical protein
VGACTRGRASGLRRLRPCRGSGRRLRRRASRRGTRRRRGRHGFAQKRLRGSPGGRCCRGSGTRRGWRDGGRWCWRSRLGRFGSRLGARDSDRNRTRHLDHGRPLLPIRARAPMLHSKGGLPHFFHPPRPVPIPLRLGRCLGRRSAEHLGGRGFPAGCASSQHQHQTELCSVSYIHA